MSIWRYCAQIELRRAVSLFDSHLFQEVMHISFKKWRKAGQVLDVPLPTLDDESRGGWDLTYSLALYNSVSGKLSTER